MLWCWRPVRIDRARPLLGTIVSISAGFDDGVPGEEAVRAAFAEIADVHRLMSFHEAGSDLSRIARGGTREAVAVDPRTAEVLAFALALAEQSGGAFDPVTAARTAVTHGALPRPEGAPQAQAGSDWRDVELDGDRVRLRRPAWIDLGGVAKGYAVDRAVQGLLAAGAGQCTVNAGGDLRTSGPASERVRLRAAGPDVALIELRDAALASSGASEALETIHVDARCGDLVPSERFAAVTAAGCMLADALTKVVLASEDLAGPLLAAHAAQAHLFDPARGWRHLGAAT
jgi:thiamine biosynthesis lipoprotein